MNQEEKMETVIRQLKEKGYRITNQRKLLLRLILGSECSSCKEVYYAARKEDGKVGIAAVYRTVQLLEDMELLRKKWFYEIRESGESSKPLL